MRTSVIIPLLLGAGAFAHPHLKPNGPLAHVHHRRQDQLLRVYTSTIGNEVEVVDEYVKIVYGDAPADPAPAPASTTSASSTSSPVPVAVAVPEKLQVAPVRNNKQEAQVQPAVVQPSTTAASVTPTPSSSPVQAAAPPPQTSTPSVASTGGSTGSSNDGAPLSGGISILTTANKYRAMFGQAPFTYSSTLAGNAATTNANNGANQMVHELNAGSFAQCIGETEEDNNAAATSTGLTPFELTYLAWLCEIPDSKITTLCDQMTAASNDKPNYADPGHAEIIKSTSYTQMGCNYLTATNPTAQSGYNKWVGMWTCDFK